MTLICRDSFTRPSLIRIIKQSKADQEMTLRKENKPEVEVGRIPEEMQVLCQEAGFSCEPICAFSRRVKHRSESEDRSKSARKLCGLIGFCLIFILVEIIGGVKANSLAVLTDAAHLLTDVIGFSISLFTVWASGWEATPDHSFGFFRLEVLGALFSVQLIWLISGILIYEAIDRIIHRNLMVKGNLMFLTAAFGILINLMMMKWLGHDHIHHACGSQGHCHGKEDADSVIEDDEKINPISSPGDEHRCEIHHHHNHCHGMEDAESITEDEKTNLISSPADEHRCEIHHHQEQNQEMANWIGLPLNELKQKHVNMNLQGAYLHILGDLIQSIGVMIGGAVIWAKPDWLIVDLICTLGFSVLVLLTTVSMLRKLLAILMESTPNGIDIARLETGLRAIKGVHAVHDLHVWEMSVGKILLSCHVKAEQGANLNEILLNTREYCESSYGIHHVTVQIEQ